MAKFLIRKNTHHFVKVIIMKKTTTISSLLGLTQNQMAILLQVHTSQWSMYESGKRNIPLKAKQVLAAILGFLKFEGKSHKVQQHIMEQEELKKKRLEKLLKKNEFEYFMISKKIASSERRYNKNIQVIGLADYHNTFTYTKETLDNELLQIFATNAGGALKKSGLANLTTLLIKQKTLEYERELFNSHLNKII